MPLKKVLFISAIITRVQAQNVPLLAACAVYCVSYNSRIQITKNKCLPEDISCFCLHTWRKDIHDCASKSCAPEDTRRIDTWAAEKCAGTLYPRPTAHTNRRSENPRSTFTSVISDSSTTSNFLLPSSSPLSSNTSRSFESISGTSTTGSEPATTSSTLTTHTFSSSFFPSPTPSESSKSPVHPPSHTSIGLAAGIPCAVLLIATVIVAACMRKRIMARLSHK